MPLEWLGRLIKKEIYTKTRQCESESERDKKKETEPDVSECYKQEKRNQAPEARILESRESTRLILEARKMR